MCLRLIFFPEILIICFKKSNTVLVPIQAAYFNVKTMFFDKTLALKWNKKQKLATFYGGEVSIVVRLVMSRVQYVMTQNNRN